MTRTVLVPSPVALCLNKRIVMRQYNNDINNSVYQRVTMVIPEREDRLCFFDCCHRQSLDASFFPVPTSFYFIAMLNPSKNAA